MPFPPPRAEELPDTIAVFPLPGALLLPHGRLPLNIFEPRYLAMVEDALAAGRMFGMIQPDAAGGTYAVGCLGRVCSFAETDDGRMLITLTGLARFRTREEAPPRRGYRRMRVDFSAFTQDLAPLPAEATLRPGELEAVLRPYFLAREMEVNWDAIARMPEAVLVTTLGMLCPFEVAEKQALLEAGSLPERAAMLLALVKMGMHGEGGRRPS
ncbi:peptidase S16 [Rhodovarius crocodyli]|uniref:Peptidase S16 n=1 Tax=Rhodovarius crocodyli TaxID=1979269 RepID=A0A437MJC4_9PROT|nr:LON peptidase substrate-binding domain-containing protein [Rhodovarius crocodyli]RVT97695.1 peptidase S16 [Rhodovarius crocodyli]